MTLLDNDNFTVADGDKKQRVYGQRDLTKLDVMWRKKKWFARREDYLIDMLCRHIQFPSE